MLIQTSAADIGEYGYAHYTGKPVTPGQHELNLTPQSIADGWEAQCSCGEWRAFANLYEYPEMDKLRGALREAWDQHVAEQEQHA